MNTSTPGNRDRNVRIVRRATTGLVTAGVLGSLGVAGAVALANGSGPTQTGTTSAAQGSSAPASGDSFSQWQSGEREQDDGAGQAPPPALQPGLGGSSHGSTTGS